MNIRHPVRAGSFYESSRSSCMHHVRRLLDAAAGGGELPSPLYGGLVPHAGWMYSGALAARTFRALCAAGAPQTFVLLGADHTGMVEKGEVYDCGVWRTPLGDVAVDEELAGALVDAGEALRPNPGAHVHEHSLEVQVPLLQVLAPAAKIVPIAVPPTELAVEIGRAIGRTLAGRGGGVPVVGSTDLTHHGGHFSAPGGRGEAGERWTRANDRRMLDLIEGMRAEEVVPEAARRHNACGAGAIAAAVAACREMGATRGVCLRYTNSYEVIHEMYPDEPDDTTVGYASVVFA